MKRPSLPITLRHVTLLCGLLSFLPQSARADDLAAWRSDGKLGAFQIEVARLKAGQTLHLPPGKYEGPIVIRTPGVTLDGGGQAEISGGGVDTVVTIAAGGITLRGLRISGSGKRHEQVDAGISVQSAKEIRIIDVSVEDCLFGIDIAYSSDVEVLDSRITSKNLDLGLRGDAIRIHSSQEVLVAKTHWSHTRDVVAWYSNGVTFRDNLGEDSRYSMHSMYTNRLAIYDNQFRRNSVGIFLMYGSGVSVRNNMVSHSLGATGIGIGLKETSSVYVEDNKIIYCAGGILVDNSPWDPGTRNWFYRNTVAFSSQAVILSNDREGNEFRENTFQGNLTDVRSESRGASQSTWDGNAWDKYAGFDRNADGIGDTAYQIYHYADGLGDSHSFTGFFFGSPVQLLIETVNRLIPLTQPTVIISDGRPRLPREASPKAGERL